MIVSEWHVVDDNITVHKLACGTVYPINPNFFTRGENTLTYRIYGDPSSFDTGLTDTGKYVIDDFNVLTSFDYSQTAFAGIYLAVALIFMMFFLLYREKTLNLWFSLTAFSIAIFTFSRAGVFQSIIPKYEAALRFEVASLFTFTYCITVLIYTCGKEKFNIGLKFYSGIYALFFTAIFLPGQQFVLDSVRTYFVLLVPFILYAFLSSLCVPFVREVRDAGTEGGSLPGNVLLALSGTLRGNVIIGALLPIMLALLDQMAYVFLSYQEIVLSQYSFLFLFANVTFALASDNAEAHSKLMTIGGELRSLIIERESDLEQKSGEVEEAITSQIKFREMVSRDIRAPLGEIIGAIELQMLHTDLTEDSANWLNRLPEAERNIRKKLDAFLGDETVGNLNTLYAFETSDMRHSRSSVVANPGGTRHLFVINPKSFVTLKDLKNFLLSIERCFSVGHRAEYKVYLSRYPRDAYSAVYRYLSATPEDVTARVYAVGGDGILFDCLNGLAQFPNAELAPIPYGNANDFVCSFGVDNIELFRDIKLMSKAPARRAPSFRFCISLER